MNTETSPPIRTRTVWLFAMSGVLGAFFVLWTWLALGEGPLFAFDERCAIYWRDHGSRTALALMRFLTDLGSIATMSMVALLGAVWQFSHGRRASGRCGSPSSSAGRPRINCSRSLSIASGLRWNGATAPSWRRTRAIRAATPWAA